MLDGNVKTYWHSYYKEQDGKAVDKTPAPYYIDIVLPEESVVKGFTYVPRQDNNSGYVFNWEAYKIGDDGTETKLGAGSKVSASGNTTAKPAFNSRSLAAAMAGAVTMFTNDKQTHATLA